MTTTARRALRSNTTLPSNNNDNTPTAAPSAKMAPSKKRKAAEIEKYNCFTCAADKPARMFPDFNPSPDCEHLINTCKTCLRKWVEASIEGANFKTGVSGGGAGGEDGGEGEGAKGEAEVWGIGCPQCEGVMRAVNVQHAVPKKVFKRFDELERKHVGDTTPNWRWCLVPDCRAGQVHVSKPALTAPQPEPAQEPPTKRRKRTYIPFKKLSVAEPPAEEPDIITCNTCSARACARCDRPMHDGETCAEYQTRTKDRIDEEDKALKAVQKLSRPCPGCSKNIQKNGGCPSMHCSQCGAHFCWNCLEVFKKGYCKCRPEPPPRPPGRGVFGVF